MLVINNLSKNFADKKLFQNVQLTLYKGEKVCLMGSNGAGKSTLFKMIQGIDTEYQGSIEFHQSLKIITIAQELPQSDLSLFDYICESLDFSNTLKELEKLEEKISQGQTDEKTLHLYGEKRSLFEQNGGYNFIYEVKKVLEGLDFVEQIHFHRPINSLSGGEVRRALLAKALIQKADILLLDEPTNHLDLKNISFLENFLKKSSSTIFFISHDIQFIENVADVVVSISKQKLDRFEGSYSQYLQYVEDRNADIEKQGKLINTEINKLRPTAEKFRAGSRSTQAQNLFRRIDKLEHSLEEIGYKIVFDKPIRLHAKIHFEKAINPILSIDNMDISIEDRLLMHIDKIRINEKEHWALLGHNGAGKTTLIKDLEAAFYTKNSKMLFSRNVSLGIYKQEDPNFFKGHENVSTLDYLRKRFLSDYKEIDYHKFLGEFHIFSHLPIRSLSGGEKSKLRLLCLLLSGHNILILDEPTNHMDMASVQGICNILKDYKGSIILITHDRKILKILEPNLLVIQNKSLNIHDKSELKSILRHLSSYQKEISLKTEKKNIVTEKPVLSLNKIKYLEKEQEKTLKSIELVEKVRQELEQKQFLKEYYENSDQFKELQNDISNKEKEHKELLSYWEEVSLQLEVDNPSS